ncbi:MAG: plastocyanin/azurin family copper-binding protein [Candidatus Bipolaricaulia bacterium]
MPDLRILLAVALVAVLGLVLLQGPSLLPDSSTMQPRSEQGHHNDDQAHHDEGQQHEDHHGPSDSSESASRPAEEDVHVVRLISTGDGEYHFEPHVVRLQPGDTVRWKLESGTHTTTAYHPANGDRPRRIPEGAEPWDSGFLTEDGSTTFERTFTVEGVYDYFCVPHEGYGMVGTLVVGEPTDGPGLSEPPSSLPETARTKIRELNAMVRTGSGSDGHGHAE